MGELSQEARRTLSSVRTAYDHSHDQPMAGCVAVLGGYAALAAALTALAARRNLRLPQRLPARDLALDGLAVHKAARLLAKDAVTSPLRAPFTRFAGASGSSEVSEEVRRHGVRHAFGELVSCPFCLAPWLASSYIAGLLVAPRRTRSMAAVFAVVGVSDVLQQVYGRLKSS